MKIFDYAIKSMLAFPLLLIVSCSQPEEVDPFREDFKVRIQDISSSATIKDAKLNFYDQSKFAFFDGRDEFKKYVGNSLSDENGIASWAGGERITITHSDYWPVEYYPWEGGIFSPNKNVNILYDASFKGNIFQLIPKATINLNTLSSIEDSIASKVSFELVAYDSNYQIINFDSDLISYKKFEIAKEPDFELNGPGDCYFEIYINYYDSAGMYLYTKSSDTLFIERSESLHLTLSI